MYAHHFSFYLLLCFFTHTVLGQNQYPLNDSLGLAYSELLQLRLKNAQNILNEYSVSRDDPAIYLLENYIDFYTLFIGERTIEYERRIPNKANRLKRIKKCKDDTPYYRFSQANILVQWALVDIKFENYFTAFRSLSSAYDLLNDNVAQYPNFQPNHMILGAIHALIGTIPDNYQWAVRLLGFKGTIEEGNAELLSVIQQSGHQSIFHSEAVVLYALINLHLKNNRREAWEVLSRYNMEQAGPLSNFVHANIAMRTYQNDAAIQILKHAKTDPNALPFHHLQLLRGIAHLRKLDESCTRYLQSYVRNFKGSSYLKEAFLMLAWQDLLFHNGKKYDDWMKLCVSQGKAQTDEDKNALWEALNGDRPHPKLLKARLLFDGGYFQEAKMLLTNELCADDLTEAQVLEYYYRLGRINEMLHLDKEAIQAFNLLLSICHEPANYLLCSAHLYLGNIYEEKSAFSRAKAHYKQCLALHPNRYLTGLHQKAKAGLTRIIHGFP